MHAALYYTYILNKKASHLYPHAVIDLFFVSIVSKFTQVIYAVYPKACRTRELSAELTVTRGYASSKQNPPCAAKF